MAKDYSNTIKLCVQNLNKMFKGSEWDDDEKVVKLFSILYQSIHPHIYDFLVPQKKNESENEIRDIIQKYVIGYVDKKRKITYIGCINTIKSKIVKLESKKNINKKIIAQYMELYDNFMALASFRSFEYYCKYMQSIFDFTLWDDTERAYTGYWYYAGRMVLDKDINFIEKQLPTGTGKSMSDCFLQSWIFGYNIDNDILKICGNDKFTTDCFNNVLKLMESKKYAKVFPYYEQFGCKRSNIFSFCAVKELKFAIRGSTKSTNLRICTKLSDTNGVRARFLFIDDITQQDDTATAMSKDIADFRREWFRRNYNLRDFYIFASGTTYSQFDILSWLKNENNFFNAQKSPRNEFTWVANSNFIVKNGIAVFVKVPALDKNDESVFPTIRDTDACKKMREDDFATFMAMEQQEPLPPDNSPFYFTKLRQYTTLPQIGENNRSEFCVAALDTKRRGKDFLSMPICFEADDPENKGESVFYIKDWLYDQRPMKECLPLIVSKIIQHNITRLFVERNTEECIETLLQDRLRAKGYTSCVIEEIYSTEPKDKRITNAEGDIKSKIIFPQQGMYANSSDIGMALLNVYGYSYTGKNLHDDAPDSLALFSKRFIFGKQRGIKKAKILYI